MELHLTIFRIAEAFYRFTELVRLISPAVLFWLFSEWKMLIELGTPHAMCLPDASRSLGPSEQSEYGTAVGGRTGSSYRPSEKKLAGSRQLGDTREVLRGLKAAQDDASVVLNFV